MFKFIYYNERASRSHGKRTKYFEIKHITIADATIHTNNTEQRPPER